MKNICLFISLLLLTTLLHEAQGIKSRKLLTKTSGSTSKCLQDHKKIEGNASEAKDNDKVSNSATTRQGQDGWKQENLSVKSSAVEDYPDAVELAGMDYSPARRKSPIHN